MTDLANFAEQAKIYICDHKIPVTTYQSRFFLTLVSGVKTSTSCHYYGDLDGENLAHDERLSEMRHQYHVWRHAERQAAYIGFEHYRRAFLIDFLPINIASQHKNLLELRQRFARNDRDCLHSLPEYDFDEYIRLRNSNCDTYPEIYHKWISSFDVVLPRPLFDETLRQQWTWTHISQYWDQFVSVIHDASYFKKHTNFIDFDIMRPSFFNMYIMRWEIFDQYMEFWTECADKLSNILPHEPRLLGHFSERLINLFIHQKIIEQPALRVLKLPVLYRK